MSLVKPFLFAKLKADFSCLGGQAFLIVVIGDEGWPWAGGGQIARFYLPILAQGCFG